jgi:hypothetical protein
VDSRGGIKAILHTNYKKVIEDKGRVKYSYDKRFVRQTVVTSTQGQHSMYCRYFFKPVRPFIQEPFPLRPVKKVLRNRKQNKVTQVI